MDPRIYREVWGERYPHLLKGHTATHEGCDRCTGWLAAWHGSQISKLGQAPELRAGVHEARR